MLIINTGLEFSNSLIIGGLSTLLALFIIIIGIDLFLFGKSVFSRYHIGRWQDQTDWISSVKKINLKWLKQTPTVKLTDNDRYVFLDLLKGHYRNSTIQSWQEAGTLLGSIATKDSESIIDTFLDSKIDFNTGKWKNAPGYVDSAMLAYAITKTNVNHDKLKPVLDDTIALIESCIGNDGTVYYRDFIPDIRFVDTIGFICPLLTYYGVTYGEVKYIDLAILQIKDYINKAFLKDLSIPPHAFDLEKKVPLGVYGWGRGLGWFILGIVDMYNELPEDNEHKQYLEGLIVKTAQDTLQFQDENGSFNAMLFVELSRHDSSITTLAGWLFFNAYLISNNIAFKDAAEKCIKSLMQVTRRNGVIDFCQGDTKGIGIYAETFDHMPFVQGLTVRLVHSMNNNSL